jgi:hypothetical protein
MMPILISAPFAVSAIATPANTSAVTAATRNLRFIAFLLLWICVPGKRHRAGTA